MLFHDDEGDDDPITDPLRSYEINVYIQVLDTVIESISSRFKKQEQLCVDFTCLGPINFKPGVILPENALNGVYENIFNYCSEISNEEFRNEYIDFIIKWNKIKKKCKLCIWWTNELWWQYKW